MVQHPTTQGFTPLPGSHDVWARPDHNNNEKLKDTTTINNNYKPVDIELAEPKADNNPKHTATAKQKRTSRRALCVSLFKVLWFSLIYTFALLGLMLVFLNAARQCNEYSTVGCEERGGRLEYEAVSGFWMRLVERHRYVCNGLEGAR